MFRPIVFLPVWLLPLGGFLFNPADNASAAAPDRPNIVLIMIDDLGAECVGVYGGTSYETPVMDKLAAEGMRFTNAYTPPLCTPTRVQIMSGQYPFRNGWPVGIWTKDRPHQFVDPDRLPMGAMMQKCGYKTAIAGKWQLGRFDDHPDHARKCGFDAHCLWMWKNDIAEGGKTPRYWDPAVWKDGRQMKETKGKFGPDLYCDALIEFMRKHREEPFFAYYPMALTHLPFIVPPESDAKTSPEKFAAMVHYADRLIGRIVSELEQLGLRENTLVLVTGDNGTPGKVTSKLGDKTIPGGKHQMTEAGTRVPLIANWPGTVPAGAVRDDLVDTSDVLPTLAEIADTKPPAGHLVDGHVVDGRSFAAQLRGEEGTPREWVYLQLKDKWFLRDKKYRLDSDGSFYDMSDRYAAKKLKSPLSEEAKAAKGRLEKAFAGLRGSGTP